MNTYLDTSRLLEEFCCTTILFVTGMSSLICEYITGRTECFRAFLFLIMSCHMWGRCCESFVTFQTAVWDCLLAFSWNE